MYLIILEDMEVRKSEKITFDLMKQWDNGLIEIIDIRNSKQPLMYANNRLSATLTWDTIKDIK